MMKEGELYWICGWCRRESPGPYKPPGPCLHCVPNHEGGDVAWDWMLVRVVIHDEPDPELPDNVIPFRKKVNE